MNNFKLHKNSQKKIYKEDKIYFITTVTYKRYEYFKHGLFCKILWDDIFFASKIKNFNIYAFVILFEHLHLLIKPYGDYNISNIMQNIKRTSSLHINKILKNNFNLHHRIIEGENIYSRLHPYNFHFQSNKPRLQNIPKFKWQQSFQDHVIRNNRDLTNHINYIKINPYKHEIINKNKKYEWIYVNKNLC